MLGKKRSLEEVNQFLSNYKKDIYERLDNIKLRFLNIQYLEDVKNQIKELKDNILSIKNQIKTQKKICSNIGQYIVKAKVSNISK